MDKVADIIGVRTKQKQPWKGLRVSCKNNIGRKGSKEAGPFMEDKIW